MKTVSCKLKKSVLFLYFNKNSNFQSVKIRKILNLDHTNMKTSRENISESTVLPMRGIVGKIIWLRITNS